MHDLSYFRSNFDRIAQRLATRGEIPGLERFRELDGQRRAAISQSEQLKAQVNVESDAIGQLRRLGADANLQREQVRAKKERIAFLDAEVKSLDVAFHDLLAGIPNVPHESVQIGRAHV